MFVTQILKGKTNTEISRIQSSAKRRGRVIDNNDEKNKNKDSKISKISKCRDKHEKNEYNNGQVNQ